MAFLAGARMRLGQATVAVEAKALLPVWLQYAASMRADRAWAVIQPGGWWRFIARRPAWQSVQYFCAWQF